jgi:hypothetical protein
MEINKQVEKLLEGARYIANKEEYPNDASIYYHEDDVEKAITKALSITAVVQAKPEVCECYNEGIKHYLKDLDWYCSLCKKPLRAN